jgi:hypothetical protein
MYYMKENFSIRLDDGQRKKLADIAAAYGIKPAAVISMAVTALIQYVEKYGSLPPMLDMGRKITAGDSAVPTISSSANARIAQLNETPEATAPAQSRTPVSYRARSKSKTRRA